MFAFAQVKATRKVYLVQTPKSVLLEVPEVVTVGVVGSVLSWK